MRIIIYCIILALLLLLPVDRADVADLEPIQAVRLYEENGQFVLETDTEDRGAGATVEEALQDMKLRSPGLIYLDTAQFLLVSENTQKEIPQLQSLLKGSVRVCLWEGQGSVADAAVYVDAHKLGIKLSQWHAGVKLPNLPVETFTKKVENADLTFLRASGKIRQASPRGGAGMHSEEKC